MKAILEYGPLIVFFVFYKLFDIYWATGALMVGAVISVAYIYATEKTVSKRLLVLYGFVLFAGGLTLFFQDDTFLKWKVSVVYGLFGLALLVSRYGFKKNLLREGLKEKLELPNNIWDRTNLAWASLFFLIAVANVYVAFSMSQDTWVNFKVFGITAITFVFVFINILMIYKYLPEEEEEKKEQ
ncbi:septation protein A [Flocculibacter collagenilyticus]|uniref:septation protein A n=1 Tax=Flocculibacter collagenilyticus TaxID=2744479 RepID=UPI0018F46040|nr:septation protein A [Flocculibacter collagenilyticus]